VEHPRQLEGLALDIYDALARIMVESLAVANGGLSHLVNLPANASGPLDPSITLTGSGGQLVQDIAAAVIGAGNILCDMMGALFT
jgi:hypothetical protein